MNERTYSCPLDAIKLANIEAMLSARPDYDIKQENGQRLYGPPEHWSEPIPCRGSEIFIGRLPRDCYEDELVPIFESIGVIYKMRLMMDFSGTNRGFAFLTYTKPSDALRAVNTLDGREVREGHPIGVMLSWDNRRLFIGGIPRNKTKKQILNEMKRVTESVKDVIVYMSVNSNNTRNRGFAFVEYENHYAAAMARRKMAQGFKLWNFHEIRVDWADPEPELDEETMSKVQVLHVRNLSDKISDHELKELFSFDGLHVERVKRIKDFAFIHYESRREAELALDSIHCKSFIKNNPQYKSLQATWARPPKSALRKKRTVSMTSNSSQHTPNTPNNLMLVPTMPSISQSPTIMDMNQSQNDYRMQYLPNTTHMPQVVPINYVSSYDFNRYQDYMRQIVFKK